MIAIKVSRAQLNKKSDLLSQLKPYYQVKNSLGQINSKPVPGNNGNPTWDEVFPFNMSTDPSLHISVWDKDTFTKDDCLGETTINVTGALQTGMTSTWHPIFWKGQQTGQIFVEIQQSGNSYQPFSQPTYQPGFNPAQYSQTLNNNYPPQGPSGF